MESRVLKNLTFKGIDGLQIAYDVYLPILDSKNVIIQIAHGMVEHKERYKWLCENLASCGYIVAINDHRGHGKSIDTAHPWGEMSGIFIESKKTDSINQANLDSKNNSVMLRFHEVKAKHLNENKENIESTNAKLNTSPITLSHDKLNLENLISIKTLLESTTQNIQEKTYTTINSVITEFNLDSKSGFIKAIMDMYFLSQILTNSFKNKKLVLLGHSMGSLLSRGYFKLFAQNLSALILSGSPAYNPLLKTGIFLAKFFKALKLESSGQKVINNLSFGGFNKTFANIKDSPHAIGACAWLSRDKAVVRAYIDDKACQFIFSLDSFIALFRGTLWVQSVLDSKSFFNENKNAKKPPIYIISGADDACGDFGKGVEKIAKNFESSGFSVTLTLYPHARHEIFNELNKVEILNNLISWLKNNEL